MWRKRIVQNLSVCTTLFSLFTIFLLIHINSFEELSTHNHASDDMIVTIPDRRALLGTGEDGGSKEYALGHGDQINQHVKISYQITHQSHNHANATHKTQKRKHVQNIEDANDLKLADLSEIWMIDLEERNSEDYKLPGEDFNEDVPACELRQRCNRIRAAMKLSWTRYKECAWGSDKLHPDTCTGSNWFGIGLTIIDSLDTLFLMGLKEEFNEALEFVSNINFREGADNVNIFEITIRVLGAFLTMAHITRNPIFTSKSVELGDILVESGAFKTASGVPLSDIDLSTGVAHMPTCNGCSRLSSLSEVTTIQLEFNELTRVSHDYKYKDATDRAMGAVLDNLPPDRLPRNYVDVRTAKTSGMLTLGARGDSYYEYLLKQWIQTKHQRYLEEYNEAIISINSKLVFSSQRNLTYIAELTKTNKVNHKMDHLVCFLPGTLALGVHLGAAPNWHLNLAEELIRSCVAMYHTPSGLAPEIVKFDKESRLYSSSADEFSLLRPETVESLFVLWRVTHKARYREWAWHIYSAMERSAMHPQYGFSSMGMVGSKAPVRKGHLESFFLAETLKYLYLINGPDDILPLDRYVFNTEAHAFPIKSEFFQNRT